MFPVTYRVNAAGHMEVGGCDLVKLAREHGTPLYVYDEATVRQRASEYVAAMGSAGQVLYSAKAFASPRFLRVIAEEGLGLDVVSAGELYLAQKSGATGDRIHFLGNNKSHEDLEAAYRAGATIVVDGAYEFELLREIVPEGKRTPVMLRLSPGVKPDTHSHISTGQLDSKFGFSIESGAAFKAIAEALQHPRLEVVGLHSHLGSQILALGAYTQAMEIMLDLLVLLRDELHFEPRKLGAGGGLGIAYTRDDDPPTPRQFVETIRHALETGCARRDLKVPGLVVEPGRSIAGPAGMAVYTVGSIKDIPEVRRYVAVDGGMGDNIRPKLYGARYEAFLASNPDHAPDRMVTIAGKYCESTDILITDIEMPELKPGDIIAMPAAGAYCLAMSSNYNGIPRPEVLMVGDGQAHVMRRRETLDDLIAAEVF
ncbi:MAG: diaminopimelate decarboxylase [Actinobacteria bacterium 13_1_20CM_2_65_11]|nr:MAG: diaminopimelate decarboxylase [Actinobacteria bacterium 13_1_20CM_2_65_11]